MLVSGAKMRRKGLIALTVSKNLRDIVFERDSYTCVLCDKAATNAHHVVRRSHGGANHPHNLVALCRQHHDLIHGTIWHGIEMTTDEAEQTVFEYVRDCYAQSIERGHWRGGN